jgi:hypothetical protein
MVVARDRGVELGMARVQAMVHMQAVEVEVKGVVVANTMVLDLVAGQVTAQALVDIMKIHWTVMLVDLLALAVPVVAVVEDKQLEVIMGLVAMDLVAVVDLALAMQLTTTIMEVVIQMHILMVVVVVTDMVQMAGEAAAVALDLVLAMPTRNFLHRANLSMEPSPLCVKWVPYNLFSFLCVFRYVCYMK